MNIRTLMTRNVTCVGPTDSLSEVYELMGELEIRHLPVVKEDNTLIGILSDRDILLEATSEKGSVVVPAVDVASVMTSDVITCRTTDSLSDIAEIMLARKIDAIPVIDAQGKIFGIITSSDFIELSVQRPPLAFSGCPEIPFQFALKRYQSSSRLQGPTY